MADREREYQIVGAFLRRGDELLMVRQRGPLDRDPYWALPGGAVERGELLTEALARELREETGIEALAFGQPVCVVQVHDTVEALRSMVVVLEVAAWCGECVPADPDGLVLEARFVPLPEAVSLLRRFDRPCLRDPILAYLEDGAEAGGLWLYRRTQEGESVVARLPW